MSEDEFLIQCLKLLLGVVVGFFVIFGLYRINSNIKAVKTLLEQQR